MLLLAAACVASLAVSRPALAEATKLRVGFQFGLTFLPLIVMRQEHLIEQQAKAAGLGDVTVEWTQSAGGDVLNAALLSGDLDLAAAGYSSFLILWSRTRGRMVKGLFGYGHAPFTLVTSNPAIRTVADITDKDRIAVPAVRSSVQAIYLEMAAEKAFGPDGPAWIDKLTVSRSHPDATAALLGRTEINAHFSTSPYAERELAAPGIHAVFQTEDVTGQPVSSGLVYGTARLYESSPKLMEALRRAMQQAVDLINTDKPRAARIYLAATREQIEPAALAAMMGGKGVGYELAPLGAMLMARFMGRTGQIPVVPESWKELFFPMAHDLDGN